MWIDQAHCNRFAVQIIKEGASVLTISSIHLAADKRGMPARIEYFFKRIILIQSAQANLKTFCAITTIF